MKKIFIISTFITILFVSCATKEAIEPQEPEVSVTEELVEDEIEEILEEEIISDDSSYIEEDLVEDVDELIMTDEQAEYLRSIDQIEDEEEVTFDEFAEDKATILQIIEELSDIMENYKFDNWKHYIEKASIDYYSNTTNLRKAQKKLPDKTINLKGLRDYFKHVFVPSRQLSKVDEIRYISKTNIKAVEVRNPEEPVIVYYYFVKENGEWKIRLPVL